jgi:hypothetical protein
VGLTIPAAEIIRKPTAPFAIGFRYPPEFEAAVILLLEQARRRKISQLAVTLGLPRRPRSTGERSQNHHFRGHCRDIAAQVVDIETGVPLYTEDEIAQAMKRMAVSNGYPTRLGVDGIEIPESEAVASVEQANVLINTTHQFADEQSFWLHEYDDTVTPPVSYRTVGGRTRKEMEEYERA